MLLKKSAGIGVLVFAASLAFAQVIVDHRCTDIARIPEEFINKARKEFRISYGHTSHGSQIISGMEALKEVNPVLYNFSTDTGKIQAGVLSLWDRIPRGDLGNPDRKTWAEQTERLLNGPGKDRNVVMWSWCGQVSSASRSDIQTYLNLMEDLEKKFPRVKFIYMTGHLDGSGEKGNLHERNEQIRDFCRKNKKILFDFADIESYAPTGGIDYMKLGAKDSCVLRVKKRAFNWAEDWINKNPNHNLELPSRAAHTHPLNAAMKGRAFWWLLAELAGWQPPPKTSNTTISPIARVAAPVNTPQAVQQAEVASHLYNFSKIQDYRPWAASGTSSPIIPEDGKGILIPLEKDVSAVMFRGRMCVKELEFKAQIVKGNTLAWYINTDWIENLSPKNGIGGIIRGDECLLLINGNLSKYKNPEGAGIKEFHSQVAIRGNRLFWRINRKPVADVEIPQANADRAGSLVIGGWRSEIRLGAVFFKAQ
ncbi:MAG: hypothetical protein JXR78_18610 [Victivallales bacterium]|nr:hypothetical protein [Victivallales bacterium]